jgi:prepilin-type N-terminal cleavage/methylation domain-containing protein
LTARRFSILSQGFSFLEIVVTMSLIVVLAALVVPCWGMIARSRSKQAATSLVMDSLERARQTAITSKKDVWVIFQHTEGTACDSLRLLSKEGNVITPLDRWQSLPDGISFCETVDSMMQEPPPNDLLLSACNTQTPPAGSHYGAVMFQRSGRIGVPLPGSHPLVLGLDAASVPLPESITLSRATGRALYQ